MTIDFDKFFSSYIETALWSSCSSDEDGNMLENLDDYSKEDFDEKSLQELKADCVDFLESNRAVIEKAINEDSATTEQIAHDLWLTRNGHGAGFWDGDYPVTGDELTKASKVYGSVDLYVCEGKVYAN